MTATDKEIGIWDVPNHTQIHQNIKSIADSFFREYQQFDRVELEEVIIFGSYGQGVATKGESDLDILVAVSSSADLRDETYSQYMRNLADYLTQKESQIIGSQAEYFSGVDILVYPFIERHTHLAEISDHNTKEDIECLAYSFSDGKLDVIFP